MEKLSVTIVNKMLQEAENQKIVSKHPERENELNILDDKDLEEGAEYHPMFTEYMRAIEFLYYTCCSFIYGLPQLKKHRKMIRKFEKTYCVGFLSSPILDSFFNMWEFFDAEIENSGETTSDVLILIGDKMGLIEETLTLWELLKASFNSLYSCEGISGQWAVFRSFMTGTKFDTAIPEDFSIKKQGKYMMRLLPAGKGTFLSLTTPYELEGSEKEWKQFFAKHQLYSGKEFNLQKYQHFMKRGKGPGYWLDYIQKSACNNQLPILLKGTPP